MALSHIIELRNGIVVDEAYIIVQHVAGTKNSITYNVQSYLHHLARQEGKEPLEVEGYTFTSNTNEDAENIFKQCYRHLKTIAKYEDALDVLENGQEP